VLWFLQAAGLKMGTNPPPSSKNKTIEYHR